MILNLYSRRQKRIKNQARDRLRYNSLPRSLRVQIVRVLDRTLYSRDSPDLRGLLFDEVHEHLADLYGVFTINEDGEDSIAKVSKFVLSASVKRVFDVIEASLHVAGEACNSYGSPVTPPTDIADQLNVFLREHGMGYEIHNGRVIQIDSRYVHQEVVKPALSLLEAAHFGAAEQEFQKAQDHYRHGRHEEAITESLKALESTLKVICAQRGWEFDETYTAKRLMGVVFKEDLVPKYLQSQFQALHTVLESGAPTIRNRSAAHGAGVARRHVPSHLAAYALHLTAAAVLFLAECEKKLAPLNGVPT